MICKLCAMGWIVTVRVWNLILEKDWEYISRIWILDYWRIFAHKLTLTSLTVTIQESHGLTSLQKTILGGRETWFWNLGEAGELCRTFWNGSRLENLRDWHSELLYWAELALSYSTQVWTFKALLPSEYLSHGKSGPSEDPFFFFFFFFDI